MLSPLAVVNQGPPGNICSAHEPKPHTPYPIPTHSQDLVGASSLQDLDRFGDLVSQLIEYHVIITAVEPTKLNGTTSCFTLLLS